MVVNITESAAARIRFIVAKDGRAGAFFRIKVDGGGCQGFQYVMSVSCEDMEGDVFSEKDDAKVAVDGSSIPFVLGASLDWVADLSGESFQIGNPNAASSCGCGTSFSA